MQIEVGIPLIILGFLLPIVIYILYRRYKIKKAQSLLLASGSGGGEVFDKEGERAGVVEDGV
jgi:uncharacterized membrane protein YqiK